jgi:hypothetical protein
MADVARWENEGGAISRPTTADASDEAGRLATDVAATEGTTSHGGQSETVRAQAGSASATSGPTPLRAARAAREA